MRDLAAETLDRVASFLGAHPGVLPMLAVSVVGAVLVSGPLSRRLGCGPVAAVALVLACTAPLALTLPPGAEAVPYPGERCDMVVRLPRDWGRGGQELANLVLLTPAGALLVVLLRRRAAVVAVLVALVSPVVIEGVQYLFLSLHRECETTDVVLNVTGLLLGVAVGVLLRRWRGRRRAAASGPAGRGEPARRGAS